jgi:hypothetical protein
VSNEDPMEAWLEAQRLGAEETAAYREVEALLAGASPLERRYCPSREDLVLPEAQLGVTLTKARAKHLSACPLCQSDLADYQALVELAPEPAWAGLKATLTLLWNEAAGALQQIQSGLAPAAAPALALRGEEVAAALAQTAVFEAGTLRLTWALGAAGVDLLCESEEPAPKNYRVDLSEGSGGLVESRSADGAGHVRILGLSPGAYVLKAFVPEASSPAIELSLQLDRS